MGDYEDKIKNLLRFAGPNHDKEEAGNGVGRSYMEALNESLRREAPSLLLTVNGVAKRFATREVAERELRRYTMKRPGRWRRFRMWLGRKVAG